MLLDPINYGVPLSISRSPMRPGCVFIWGGYRARRADGRMAASDGVLDTCPLHDEGSELLFRRLRMCPSGRHTRSATIRSAAYIHTIRTEGLLLRDRQERLVQPRGSHSGAGLGAEGNSERPPLKLEESLVGVVAILVLPVGLGHLQHELLEAVDAAQVQEDEAAEVRRADGARDLVRDVLQRQAEQVARDVDREVLEIEVGGDHERLERALDAERAERVAERAAGYDAGLGEDAVVDEEVEGLGDEHGGGVERGGIEGIEGIEGEVEDGGVCREEYGARDILEVAPEFIQRVEEEPDRVHAEQHVIRRHKKDVRRVWVVHCAEPECGGHLNDRIREHIEVEAGTVQALAVGWAEQQQHWRGRQRGR